MIDILRALLERRMTRAEAEAWTRERETPAFDSPTASVVFEALRRIQTDGERVRDLELHAWLDALVNGEAFVGDPDPLVRLRMDLDTLAERTGATPIHWGSHRSLRFAALASGRPFMARAATEQHDTIDVYKLAGDPWADALIELFEHFAIDDLDAVAFHPMVDLAELPVWALWRVDDNANNFEMARYRSYAKAELQERIYRERGHRQFYWVDPV
jgi:hypothetical protein